MDKSLSYVKAVHAYLWLLDQDLKGPELGDETKVGEGHSSNEIAKAVGIDTLTDERLLLGGKTIIGEGSAQKLLHELTIEGGRVAVLLNGNSQGAQTDDCAVVQEVALSDGDVSVSEPRVLVKSTDETLVGTVVAALSEWGL